jgi:hypothetical protein
LYLGWGRGAFLCPPPPLGESGGGGGAEKKKQSANFLSRLVFKGTASQDYNIKTVFFSSLVFNPPTTFKIVVFRWILITAIHFSLEYFKGTVGYDLITKINLIKT